MIGFCHFVMFCEVHHLADVHPPKYPLDPINRRNSQHGSILLHRPFQRWPVAIKKAGSEALILRWSMSSIHKPLFLLIIPGFWRGHAISTSFLITSNFWRSIRVAAVAPRLPRADALCCGAAADRGSGWMAAGWDSACAEGWKASTFQPDHPLSMYCG